MPNWLRAAWVFPLVLALSACSGGTAPTPITRPDPHGEAGSSGADSCAFVALYQGRSYTGIGVGVAPEEGQALGTATLPGCADIADGSTRPQDEVIPVAALPGVPPEVALVWRGVRDTLLVSDGAGDLPAEVQQLLAAPSCKPGDGTVDLSGTWLGIHNGDESEVDLVTPYDVDMQVHQASVPRYGRAFLTIHVPEALGRPLTEADLEGSLWKEGTISVTATCLDGSLVAQRVTASPPA